MLGWLNLGGTVAPDPDQQAPLAEAAGETAAHPALPVVRPLIGLLQRFNRALRALSSLTHRLQGKLEGHYDRRRMWFDHYVDVNWTLAKDGDPMFLERGVFNRALLAEGAELLELGCGDGWFTRHVYAPTARRVVAIDADPSAIAFARRANAGPNISYEVRDFREGLPDGSFTNVIWDGAMLYLSAEEVTSVMGSIRERLGTPGIFSGYTYADHVEWRPYIRHRMQEPEDIAAFLRPHFEHVLVLCTPHPTRTNFYFMASDAELPPANGPAVQRWLGVRARQ